MDDVFTFCICTTVVTLVLLALVLCNHSCTNTNCVGVSTFVAMTFWNYCQCVVHLMNMMIAINFFCHIRRAILFNNDPLIILSFPLFFLLFVFLACNVCTTNVTVLLHVL